MRRYLPFYLIEFFDNFELLSVGENCDVSEYHCEDNFDCDLCERTSTSRGKKKGS
jgi:hypothetical protein